MLTQCRPLWDISDFEPYISLTAMDVHVNKLHPGYIDKLNSKFGNTKLLSTPPSLVLNNLNAYVDFKDSKFYRNQMGGNVAHTLFWQVITPRVNNGLGRERLPFGVTRGEVAEQIVKLGTSQFGSGWVWGFVNPRDNFKFGMTSLRDHDTPYMRGNIPIFCIDVWEHAYFLDYLNDRSMWLRLLCNFIDFDAISNFYYHITQDNTDLLDALVLGEA